MSSNNSSSHESPSSDDEVTELSNRKEFIDPTIVQQQHVNMASTAGGIMMFGGTAVFSSVAASSGSQISSSNNFPLPEFQYLPGTSTRPPTVTIIQHSAAPVAPQSDDNDGLPSGVVLNPDLGAPQAVTVAPCQHNNWDNLRAKNSVVTLCCRDCQRKWKQQFPIPNLCPDFHARTVCCFGPHCPYLHVHRFKSTSKSPNPPGYVMGTVQDALFVQCARDVLAKNPPQTSPSVVLNDVVALYREKSSSGTVATPQFQTAPAPVPKPSNKKQRQQQQFPNYQQPPQVIVIQHVPQHHHHHHQQQQQPLQLTAAASAPTSHQPQGQQLIFLPPQPPQHHHHFPFHQPPQPPPPPPHHHHHHFTFAAAGFPSPPFFAPMRF